MARSHCEVLVHVVWATNGRRPDRLVKPDAAEGLPPTAAAFTPRPKDPPFAVGGTRDHVHLVSRLPPTVALARFVGEIKGASAHHVTHILDPGAYFQWQEGYGAFSFAAADLPAVVRYVEDQQRHHATCQTLDAWEPPLESDGSPAHKNGPSRASSSPSSATGLPPTAAAFTPRPSDMPRGVNVNDNAHEASPTARPAITPMGSPPPMTLP